MAEMRGHLAFVGDMHIAPENAGADRAQSTLDRPARRRRHLEAVLADISRSKPAALFFGGDNTNQPMDTPGYAQALNEILEKSPRPWKIIPGNHDVGSTVGWHHHDPAAMQRAVQVFRKAFQMDYWVYEAAGFQVIGINSQLFGASLAEAREQDRWLIEILRRKQSADLVRVLFLHTPPYLQNWEDRYSDGSEQMCLNPAARASFMDIVCAHPPDILVTAHVHRWWVRREKDWWWIGIPATALPLSEMGAVPDHHVPSGEDVLGWVALERDGAGWKAELRPL